MDISQIIGLLISLGAILFLLFHNVWEGLYKKKHPEEYAKRQKEKERQMHDFLESFDIDGGVAKQPKKPAKKPKHKPVVQQPQVSLPKINIPYSAVAHRKKVVQISKKSRAKIILEKVPTLKELIVISEIINRPKV